MTVTDADPWQVLASEWPHVRVYIRYLPDKWAQTVWTEDGSAYIELAHDLGPVQQRCTLAHELHHLIYGKPCRSFCDNNERDVIEATARWLLPDLAEMGDNLRRFDLGTAAAWLQVTQRVLRERLQYLTPSEAAELAPLLAGGAAGVEARAAAHEPRRSPPRLHRCAVSRMPDRPG